MMLGAVLIVGVVVLEEMVGIVVMVGVVVVLKVVEMEPVVEMFGEVMVGELRIGEVGMIGLCIGSFTLLSMLLLMLGRFSGGP